MASVWLAFVFPSNVLRVRRLPLLLACADAYVFRPSLSFLRAMAATLTNLRETDEVEYLITARSWDYLKGFLGVFATCEEDFVSLIDGMYPTERPVDISARDSMQLEAQNVFLAVDDLYHVRMMCVCVRCLCAWFVLLFRFCLPVRGVREEIRKIGTASSIASRVVKAKQ